MPLKALIFDMDGTLADSDPIHAQAFAELLEPHGIAVDDEFYRSRISGRTNELIFADLLPGHSLGDRQRLADEKEAIFRRMAIALQPLPGLLRLIEWAEANGLALALVTNAPAANARHMLQALNLDARLPVKVLAEEVARGKPDPLPYLTALERLGVTAGETVAFEDFPSGIKAAKAAGIFTFGVLTGQPAHALDAAGADAVISDFEDVHLARMLRERLAA